jgi:hypothetical protein
LDASDEPFGITVRARCPRWRLDDLDVVCSEHRVEGCGELRVGSRTRTEPVDQIVEVYEEVTGLLGDPLAVG